MDTIANLLTSLRNAELAGLTSASVPLTSANRAVLGVLRQSGVVADIEEQDATIRVSLPQPLTRHHYKRLSKPSRRVYVGAKQIPTVRQGQGFVILSTSAGVMLGQDAKKQSLGGELLCEVY